MLHVGSIVIRVEDLRRQTEFWTAALDLVPREPLTDDPAQDFMLLKPRDGSGPNVSLDRMRSEVHIPPRIHLDLYAEDQAAEIARLKGLGATEIRWERRPIDADYVIMADPEGNRFCVIETAPRAAER
jgi:predicted enzyme related to lactoylglutathione lyase